MVAVLAALAASYVLTRRAADHAGGHRDHRGGVRRPDAVLHNDTFIKIKPTILYALFGAVLLGGLFFGKSFLGVVFDSLFHLTEEGWRKLTVRWAIVLFRARRAQRDRLAQHLDQCLGGFQGVRRDAAHVPVRRAAISAAEEIRGRAGGRRSVSSDESI
jgi:hypothetical protein